MPPGWEVAEIIVLASSNVESLVTELFPAAELSSFMAISPSIQILLTKLFCRDFGLGAGIGFWHGDLGDHFQGLALSH